MENGTRMREWEEFGDSRRFLTDTFWADTDIFRILSPIFLHYSNHSQKSLQSKLSQLTRIWKKLTYTEMFAI